MNYFGQQIYIWIMFAVVPFLALFFIWAWRVKQKLIRQFVQSRLLASLTVGVAPARQKLRLVLLTVAVMFVFIALGRPRWGFTWQEAKQQGIDILVAIDTSRSMLAQDVPPNRLTRAKLAAIDLMRQAKSDRLGLIAFTGTAFLQAPLTLDENAFRQGVDALDVGIIPQGGTSLSDVISTADGAFEKGSDNHKVLVIFTDGEDHDDDTATLAAAEEAAKNGLIIFTIGVGTPEGEMLRAKDDNGNIGFIKDEDGNAVKSHLNETLLQKIATATAGGFYLPLRGANPMEMLYARGLAPLPKTDSSSKLTRVYDEHYHWFLAFAILCLIVETFLPERKRVKQTEPARATEDLTGGRTAATIVTCLLLMPMLAFSSPSTAYKKFESGKFGDAQLEYEHLAAQKTNDYRLQYNAGTAAYKAKELESAQRHLNAVLNSPEIAADLPTQQHTYYNLGNTLFQMGAANQEPDKQKENWEQAVENYQHALKLDPQDKDAKNNLAFVQKKLEELKQQQQQHQKGDKNDKDKKDDKDQKNQDQKDQNKDQKDQNKDSKDDKNKDDKKDQQSKDQKDSKDKKDQQGKKDDQKSAQDKQKEEQKKQDQAQKDKDKEKAKQEKARRDKEKKEKEKQAQEAQDKAGKSGEKPEEQQAQMAGQPARMTMQQAKQFLDAQKDQEKALIFTPENKPEKPRPPGKFKDW